MRAKRAKEIRRVIAEIVRRSDQQLPEHTHIGVKRKRGHARMLMLQRERKELIDTLRLERGISPEMAKQFFPAVRDHGVTVECIGQRKAYKAAKRLYLADKRSGVR